MWRGLVLSSWKAGKLVNLKFLLMCSQYEVIVFAGGQPSMPDEQPIRQRRRQEAIPPTSSDNSMEYYAENNMSLSSGFPRLPSIFCVPLLPPRRDISATKVTSPPPFCSQVSALSLYQFWPSADGRYSLPPGAVVDASSCCFASKKYPCSHDEQSILHDFRWSGRCPNSILPWGCRKAFQDLEISTRLLIFNHLVSHPPWLWKVLINIGDRRCTFA